MSELKCTPHENIHSVCVPYVNNLQMDSDFKKN